MEFNPAAVSTREWTTEPADRIAALLDAERDWWRRHLYWDLDTAWASIEPARAAGRLPGVIATATGEAADGWAFYLRHHQTLQLGAIVAYHEAVTTALVDHMLRSPAAQGVPLAVSFTRDQAPGLAAVFEARDFQLEHYTYLELALGSGHELSMPCRMWAPADLAPTVDLVARAYRNSAELRPFAPDNRQEDWIEYVTQLVASPACGRFLPWASIVCDATRGTGLHGAAIVTTISERTAHLAQIVVDPRARGRGLGRALVESAIGAVAARGFERMTLLVAASNTRASTLYDRLGFRQTATFLAAVKRQDAG
jgi:ribosomal protein S18 acetylase RimI-like enzyme